MIFRLLVIGWMVVTMVRPVGADVPQDYATRMAQWQQRREAALRNPDGWLTLAGLFWLHPGDNSFGCAPENDCSFPRGRGPAHIGTFHLKDGKVTVDTLPGVDVKPRGPVVLDAAGKVEMSLGSLHWFLIEREGRLGIRLKDRDSPILTGFKGLQYYAVDAKWRVVARFERYATPHSRTIPTAVGSATVSVLGRAVFDMDGRTCSLEIYGEPADTEFEVLFGDQTNGHGSYPAGRFLDVAAPAADGSMVLDFNQAFNPPCAFTPFATCPYPPRENRLSLPIPAGERFSGH